MRGSHKYSSTRALIPLIKTCFYIFLALTSLIETAAKMNGKNENEKEKNGGSANVANVKSRLREVVVKLPEVPQTC